MKIQVSMIEIVAFDADDTLWHNETLYSITHEKYEELLSAYHERKWIKKKLFETEMRNLRYYGYGIKGFTLSMIETAIELTEGRITGGEIAKILELSRNMLKAPVELLDHAAETIKSASRSYPLMLITKGDLFDQESKIAQSGLSDYFKYIEILTRKTPETYREVLSKYGIKPESFLMVGNSLRSDILPVLEIGSQAVFVPYPLCWEHERVSESELDQMSYHELEHIGQLLHLLAKLQPQASSTS
jgi:putative hydrolase of the HAD superfamily